MKLCKDCKWCKRGGWPYYFHECNSPQSISTDKVNGKLNICEVERLGCRMQPACGEEGRFFEPKE